MTSAVAACYDVLKQVDTNQDGMLQWEEFWAFVAAPGRFSMPQARETSPISPAREQAPRSLTIPAEQPDGRAQAGLQALDRKNMLREVFRAFDIDNNGFITDNELLMLGKARRELGQKQGEWTKEMNASLMKRIDTDGDGKIKEVGSSSMVNLINCEIKSGSATHPPSP